MHPDQKRQEPPPSSLIFPTIPASGNPNIVDGPVTVDTSPPLILSSTTSSPFQSPSPTSSTSSASSASSTSISSEPTDSNGTPLRILIPAIVVPIVIVALVAPVVLYFFLTRHDRQRGKSRTSSRTSSKRSPESTAEIKSPTFRDYSSETQASNASEIMNFNLGPKVEKRLPAVNISRPSVDGPERRLHPQRPERPQRPDRSSPFEVLHEIEPPIGQAISHYSLAPDASTNALTTTGTQESFQELTEENMRIARLANDSRASFGRREAEASADAVSDISALEERTSRHVGGRGVDELSDVSSLYEDDRPARSDRGGGILGNHQARRSGPLRRLGNSD